MSAWQEDPLTATPVAVVARRRDRPNLPAAEPALRERLAAAEIGGGVLFNPVGAEEAGAALRAVDPVPGP